MKRALGVIPARYASTRFPGKPLASLGGKPLVEHVWRRAIEADTVDRVIIATDDDRIASACRAFGADVAMTSVEHRSGTDRVAEVAGSLPELFDVDDPPEMATLVEPLEDVDSLFDPNHAKVVATAEGRALYFSRAPIPYYRGNETFLVPDFREALAQRPGGLVGYWKHQGIYAYRPDALFELTRMEPSPLELDESLEQLRALQAGFVIRVVESDFRSITVETPADLERAAAALAARMEARS